MICWENPAIYYKSLTTYPLSLIFPCIASFPLPPHLSPHPTSPSFSPFFFPLPSHPSFAFFLISLPSSSSFTPFLLSLPSPSFFSPFLCPLPSPLSSYPFHLALSSSLTSLGRYTSLYSYFTINNNVNHITNTPRKKVDYLGENVISNSNKRSLKLSNSLLYLRNLFPC